MEILQLANNLTSIVDFKKCTMKMLRLLMAVVVPLGLPELRHFQKWVINLQQDTKRYRQKRVLIADPLSQMKREEGHPCL